MTKTELIEIIRGIVREETKLAVAAALAQLSTALTSVDSLPPKKQNTIQTGHMPPVVSRPTGTVSEGKKSFCSNPILNEVLTKTRGGVPQDMYGASFNPRELVREGAMPEIPQNAPESIIDSMVNNYDESAGVSIPPAMAARFNNILAAPTKKR